MHLVDRVEVVDLHGIVETAVVAQVATCRSGVVERVQNVVELILFVGREVHFVREGQSVLLAVESVLVVGTCPIAIVFVATLPGVVIGHNALIVNREDFGLRVGNAFICAIVITTLQCDQIHRVDLVAGVEVCTPIPAFVGHSRRTCHQVHCRIVEHLAEALATVRQARFHTLHIGRCRDREFTCLRRKVGVAVQKVVIRS